MEMRPLPPTAWLVLLATVVVLLTTGCAAAPASRAEQILISTPCAAASSRPARPVLPISGLSAADEPSFVVKTYAATVEVLKGYGESLELLLDSCK